MPTDNIVTSDILKTLEDGKHGFAKAAALMEKDAPEVCSTFVRLSQQRSSFYDELQEIAKDFDDPVEANGTIAAAIHRSWMTLKDALSGSDPAGVLDAAVQGEEHAVKSYETALEASDLSSGLRVVLVRQMAGVSNAYGEVKALRDACKPEPA